MPKEVNGDNEKTFLLLNVIFRTDGRYTVELKEKISCSFQFFNKRRPRLSAALEAPKILSAAALIRVNTVVANSEKRIVQILTNSDEFS